jgi:tRNA nucleotidyltransferase/poly(A) polymerase
MEITVDHFPKAILEVCEYFSKHHFKAFVVGGSIRDIVRGQNRPYDWDIATDALPEDVMEIFNQFRVIPTGIQHGTVTLLYEDLSIEITTFRVEGEYQDGRHPSSVQFVGDIVDDLSRRDLTINAIAYDPLNELLIDPFGGCDDIQKKILRLVGNPDDRLSEDGLRLIRIFRFVSQLGYSVDESTLNAVPRHIKTFIDVAKERIEVEFTKLVSGKNWQKAMHFLESTELLYHIIPAFQETEMNTVVPKTTLTRLEITLKLLDNLSIASSPNLRFAVLIHQLSAVPAEGFLIFPNYKEKCLQRTLKEMKLSNQRIKKILHLVFIHKVPLPYTKIELEDSEKNYQMRRFLFKIQPESFQEYLLFREAKENSCLLDPMLSLELKTDYFYRSEKQKPVYLRDLKVNGNDVVSLLDINKMKVVQREFIGICLEILRERVEFVPNINTKTELYDILSNVKQVVSLCKSFPGTDVSIVSTDHIRKLYTSNSPDYSSLESKHTYRLAIWILKCILAKKKNMVVLFDGTNLNFPTHPFHRENLAKQFKRYNPIFVNMQASEEEAKMNLASREEEQPSLTKSDANLSIFHRYQKQIKEFPQSIAIHTISPMITLSTRAKSYEADLQKLVSRIRQENHHLIILSGNVLTGKTYTANRLQPLLKLRD